MNRFWTNVRIAPLMGLPGIRLSGSTVKQNLENAEAQCNSLRALYNLFRPDVLFTMMDLSVEAEACGVELNKPENRSFSVKQHPVGNASDLAGLRIPDPGADGRMPVVLHVVEQLSRDLDCLTAAYISGPFTLASLLAGAGKALRGVIRDPQFIRELLEYSTEVIVRYALALQENGADCVCILEPTAGVLSPDQFEVNSAAYLKRIIASLEVPVILHICGDTSVLLPKMVETGCSALSLDSQVDLARVLEETEQQIQIIGNIDPVSIVAYGSRQDIEQALLEAVALAKAHPNLTISTGCDLPLDTNMDNLETFFVQSRAGFA